MAQIPPSTANPPTSATNGQPTPSSSNPQQVAPISWEGDRMFNVYIHDYFRKRGFYKAAKELVVEADIGNDAAPPINARQGFLFEWWSVFWMFFSAKTTGQGPENVMLYFHWIQNQQAERNRQLQHENEQRRQLPLTTQPPPQRPMVRPPLNGVRPPAMVNGAVPIPQPSGQLSPAGQQMQYPMSGVPHPPMPPTHQQQPPPGPGQPPPQLNGIVDPSTPHAINHPQRPPSQQQARQGPHGSLTQPQQPGHPPPSHPNSVPHLQASQRQVSRGQHDPMRPGQFHSPTMPSAPPPGPGQGQLAAHLSGMPPPQANTQQFQHLGRGPPPQGGQPNHASPRNPSQTPTQPYQQLMNHGGPMPPQQGGSGSRSATPGGHTLTQPSPALAAREPPPQGQGHAINEEMSRRFQQQQQQQPQQQSQQQQPQPPRGGVQMEQQELMSMETSMSRIPPVFLAQMKMEAGVGDRDIMTLSYEEKARLNSVFKKTMENYNGTTAPMGAGRNGRPPAPNQPPPMSGMPMYPQHAPPGARLPPSVVPVPAPGPRGQKRGSTSPTDEQAGGDSTPKDQSPPDKKRLRPSPQNPVAHTPGGADAPVVPPPMGSMPGFPPNHPASHPGGYPGPQQQQSMPPMNAMRHHGPAGGMPPGQGVPPGGLSMNLGAGPGIGGHQMPPGMPHMNLAGNPQIMGHPLSNPNAPQTQGAQTAAQQQQQQQMHYRQTMAAQAAQHMVKMPPGMAPNPANPNASSSGTEARGGVAGPAGGPGGPGPASRQTQQGKPGSMMPPPPSPAHRAENNNSGQKGPAGMMPPPAQPVSAPPSAGGLPTKEQTTPPAGTTGSSPSMRPASTSGAAPPSGSQQSGASASMSQGSTGGPATPAPGAAGGNGGGTGNNTTAPSPSAILTNRISPSAAMNSLPRPQTSGPEANTTTNAAGQNAPPPPPPPSAPPSSGPSGSIGNNIFTDFFESMDDQFGLDATFGDVDTTEFAQWIDMNPLS